MVVGLMKWEEIRNIYPHKWVKLNVLAYHIENDTKFIDDMEVIKVLTSDKEAGMELGRCSKDEAVYHTYHEKISYKITKLFGFRRKVM